MNLDKVYHNSENKKCNIIQMVRGEPEWAANRIQVGEKMLTELKNLIENQCDTVSTPNGKYVNREQLFVCIEILKDK